MEIQAFGYMVALADNLDEWVKFGGHLLGLQLIERTASKLTFRMDDRAQRLTVELRGSGASQVFGWETSDGVTLDSLAARLDKAGVSVRRPPRSIAEQRHVKDLVAFADPAGNTIEAYHGLEAATTPFEPGRPISGFRTGSLGMGHIVLNCETYGPMVSFYRDLLGFRFSDFLVTPFKGQFFHVNPRHHSFALIENGRKGIHHLMLELMNLDDVGQGYDLALGEEKRIATTLGRHANDWMTSFYVFSPSGFMVEYGWGGREVDMASWQPDEMKNGPSLWGHERAWLPAPVRARTREMTLGAAAAGVRHPVQVTDGNYQTGPEKIE